MNETNHIGARDLINVGIFTAINVVIMFVIIPSASRKDSNRCCSQAFHHFRR